ncbi:MAG: AAA family ATPase [Oligoflexia bacterium]|nr:AAA family ATPase [Oligoflexia bacterium]
MEFSYMTSANIFYKKEGQNIKAHEVVLFCNEKQKLLRNKDNPEKDNINLLDFSKELEREDNIKELEREDDIEKKKAIAKTLQDNIKEKVAIADIIKALRDNINNLLHLLPVRSIGESVIAIKTPLDHVGKSGENTLYHLQDIINKKNTTYNKYKFIYNYINKVAGIDEMGFKKSETLNFSECLARNKLTKAKTQIGNFGFGVSQCLPIFVQGALMPQFSSLMVEQPEAQLHPTAQLELGEFFADLWKKYKVGSIIETHSDNILLRLRRLIAKGYLETEEVSVAFFDFDSNNGQPIIKNLDIDKDGSIKGELPLEFFGANLEEVLQIGAKE